ncbi:MAG: hypothetical protein LAO30_02825 [Acidobacteriia bacterium]|nr:hypothetical protein [Terriglobia bacterium]
MPSRTTVVPIATPPPVLAEVPLLVGVEVVEKERASTAAPSLADPSRNWQTPMQLTANSAGAAAVASLPIAQRDAISAPIIATGASLFSGTSNVLASQGQAASAGIASVPLASPPGLNLSETRDVLPANLAADTAPAISPGPSKASLRSAELPSVFDQAASESTQWFPNISTQSSTASAQFSTNPAPVADSATPMTLADSPTSVTQVSPPPAAPPAPAASLATSSPQDQPGTTATSAAAVAGQFHANISGVTIISPEQSPTNQSPSVPATSFTPSPPLPAAPLVKAEPSSVPSNSSDEAVASSARSQSSASPPVPAANIPPPASAPMPPPTPTLQSPAKDNNVEPVTEPPTSKRPAAPQSSDPKINNSTPVDPTPVSRTTPELSSTFGSSALNTAQAYVVVPDAVAPVVQTAHASGTGFSVASNLTSNTADDIVNSDGSSLASSFDPNSKIPASTFASLAATASDVQSDAHSNAKTEASAQVTLTAASQTTASGKKSPAADLTKDKSSLANLSPDVPTTPASAKDAPAILTAPAPPASASPQQVGSDPAPALPKIHHMLDSAPPAPSIPLTAPKVSDPAGQIHVGIRTEAFGAVEIHTVVKQSQVGIAVHGDRDLARWFNSEVPSLESGLNQHHLNLTAVDLDNRHSGVQTATSFQQGQPRQNFSQSASSPAAALPEPETALEPASVSILPSDLSIRPTVTRVSILV